jgi:hypothetical protein
VRPDYDSGELARRGRWVARVVLGLILLGIALAMLQRILQVSEQRNLQATREHLANSLMSLSAESVARRQPLPPDWLSRNPFELLRWQQSDYCGELAQGQQPEPGCWYFLPAVAWVLYRSKFTDELSGSGDDLYLFQVKVVSVKGGMGAQWEKGAQVLELVSVSAAEKAARRF